jgi:hypothetical protein
MELKVVFHILLLTDDLWDALAEYPEAKKLLLEKGKEILKKEQTIVNVRIT